MPSYHRRLRWLTLSALILLAAAGVSPSQTLAQTAGAASLTPPEISDFPQLTAYLDVLDTQGGFVSNLTAADVTVLEDGQELPVTGLQAQRPGVQFVVAITSGSALNRRDSQGVTRYQQLLAGMLSGTWDDQPAGQDDFSFLATGGTNLIHASDPAELRAALENYQPPDLEASNLEMLAQALEVAADPLPRPGMERAVLFITPPQVADITGGLATLAARASQQNIHVYIWLVAAPEYFSLPPASQLAAFAGQAGGSYFAFSSDEAVPDLESYLEPLRSTYRLVYQSRLSASGPHQVSARVNLPTGAVESPAITFEISLQPPAPALVAPPVVILRSFASTPTSGEPASTDLLPVEQPLTLSVTFPDGYTRPLARTALIVDGVLVAENTAPPFESFTWDLRAYDQDGLHSLRVEAVDNLGLTGQSPEVIVQVSVPSPEQGVRAAFERQRLLVIGLVVLIAGSVLALVLILGGRIRPQVIGMGRQAARRKAAARQQSVEKDPVTQPVHIPHATSLTAKPPSRFSAWLQRRRQPAPAAPTQPVAFLTPLAEPGAPTLPAPLPIGVEPVTLGHDPLQASLVINDPSVEALHARLFRQEDGFHLVDTGTAAGTWVNYIQVPPAGAIIVHGDLIHLGRRGFRFTLRQPGQLPKPVVKPLEPPV